MPTTEVITEVKAPPQRVWEYVSQLPAYPEWIGYVEGVVAGGDAPLREGAVYRLRAKPGPKVGEYEWRVTTWDPPHRQVHEHSSGEFELEQSITLEPSPAGTRWTHTLDYRLLPSFRPLGWVLEKTTAPRKMKRDLQQAVDAAQAAIESADPLP